MTDLEEGNDEAPKLDRAARMDLLHRIVSAVSHDFNNVLATASMYSELLLHDPAVEGATAEDVQEILAAARRGAALTAFLAVIKDSRGVSLEPAPVTPQLGHVQKIIGRLLPDGVGLEMDGLAEDVEVQIDRVRLQQVIFGLVWAIGEALAESGGVVHIDLGADPDHAIIEIRGEVGGESPDAGAGGVVLDSEDPVIAGIRELVEGFGGTLRIDGDTGAAARLGLPRTGSPGPTDPADAARTEVGVVVVGDTAVERLLGAEGLGASGVAAPDDVEELATAPDALVGPASRAMFRVARRIRSEGAGTLVVLLGAAVDVELPPDLEVDSEVRLIRSPVSGTRLAEVIRAGAATSG